MFEQKPYIEKFSDNEPYVASKYRECREVSVDDCYMGGHNCHTCAHCLKWDSNFRYYKNDYCSCARKEATA